MLGATSVERGRGGRQTVGAAGALLTTCPQNHERRGQGPLVATQGTHPPRWPLKGRAGWHSYPFLPLLPCTPHNWHHCPTSQPRKLRPREGKNLPGAAQLQTRWSDARILAHSLLPPPGPGLMGAWLPANWPGQGALGLL